ncbi:MAG: alpha/beta hydrolase [Chloroflexaceae bacterium]|nr:alpha/beta hydrolase [Chloroflexaceae bacterium]
MSLLLSTAVGAASAAGGVLGLAWYASDQINPIPRRVFKDDYTFTPWELGVPFEEVELTTPDQLNLSAWWLPHPEAQSVVIGCHSHVGAKPDLLGIGTNLWRAGHHVLLFDFRGRGRSDPWPNTLASMEVSDLLTAVNYASERAPNATIGVIGFSMGAAVAILAAAQEARIAAVVADSSFTSATDVITHKMRRVLPVATEPLMALTGVLVAHRHGYHLSRVRPIDMVAHLAPRPLFVIHSTADSTTPVEHAHQLYAAAGEPRYLWLHEGSEHCGAYFADRCVYVDRVSDFFDQYLKSIE